MLLINTYAIQYITVTAMLVCHMVYIPFDLAICARMAVRSMTRDVTQV